MTNLQPLRQVRQMYHAWPPQCRGSCGQTWATWVMQNVNHYTTVCSIWRVLKLIFSNSEVKFQIQILAQCENESNAARTPLKVGILELTNVSVEVLRCEGLEVREVDICPIQQLLHCLHPRQISSQVSVTRLHILLPVVARALDAEDRLAPDGLRLNSNEKPHSQSKTMNSCIEIHQQHFQSGQVFQAKLQSKCHTR